MIQIIDQSIILGKLETKEGLLELINGIRFKTIEDTIKRNYSMENYGRQVIHQMKDLLNRYYRLLELDELKRQLTELSKNLSEKKDFLFYRDQVYLYSDLLLMKKQYNENQEIIDLINRSITELRRE